MTEREPAQIRNPLAPLLEQQLSAVVFVQDYLQLDLDESRLTFSIWPIVSTPSGECLFSSTGYRDALCSLISRTISSVYSGGDRVDVSFGGLSRICCELSERPGDDGERVLFFAADGKWWASW